MRLDLNLVSILEAIMLEGNVTRAAASLGMSQPAVSNALRRARRLTNDELFIKVADGVRPTSRMLAMWPGLRTSLVNIRSTIAPQTFDARSDTTTFRAAITDSVAVEAVSAITLTVRKLAPLARIAFSFHTNAMSIEAVEKGTLDCAVGMFPALPRGIHVKSLLADPYVCVMRHGHRLSRRMTLDDFVQAPHVLVTPSGENLGVVDGWLSLQGQTRNIVVVVNRFVDALKIAAASDLVTCLPRGFFDRYHRRLFQIDRLCASELPFEAEKILYKIIWHERTHVHPAHVWFRSIVSMACSKPEASGKTSRKRCPPSLR